MVCSKVDDGGEENELEAAEEGVSNEGAEEREERSDADPCVDVLSGGWSRLVQFVCEMMKMAAFHPPLGDVFWGGVGRAVGELESSTGTFSRIWGPSSGEPLLL
ncbi:hypothetical protein TIFTF001_024662 [Ficus carica]|uniref:Uncharacterized protein n=1 Tax=Ficus carica TaxID=3494 RepID=A0AA88AMG1_FICCA|nr:hypothetical protein TIFTF001_024662 [Ficus carica]